MTIGRNLGIILWIAIRRIVERVFLLEHLGIGAVADGVFTDTRLCIDLQHHIMLRAPT